MAQEPNDPFDPPSEFSDGIVGQFDRAERPGARIRPQYRRRFTPATAERPAVLVITATIAPGRHTYSITQPPGGPLPTKIELEPSTDYRHTRPVPTSIRPRTRIERGRLDRPGNPRARRRGHLVCADRADRRRRPGKLEIKGTIDMQVCETGGSCEPGRRSNSPHDSQRTWISHRRSRTNSDQSANRAIRNPTRRQVPVRNLRREAQRPARAGRRPSRRIGATRVHGHAAGRRPHLCPCRSRRAARHEADAHRDPARVGPRAASGR